ncbi:MAG: hypothetical protein NZ951_03165 [Dehalococcoidia bacterium]|nr:hypothetical protein [Dehalococcoidia bacterium]MDW8119419.1 hypothetical protein [Chloroflexota bacterium]
MEQKITWTMLIVMTLALLGCSLFILLSKTFTADREKWATGVIGGLMGFWFNEAPRVKR